MSAAGVAKKGLWTEHVDAASGRKYYFNLVHGRSYWELPEELQAAVMRPQWNEDESDAADEAITSDATASGNGTLEADALQARIQRAMQHQQDKQHGQDNNSGMS
ncbi:Aste57867_8173 [Aphanomyces stellatus]|uniref:Aste57867_8173 protein n=1 Tax=Aphanomyces stellatus TaxID=120398 RepID=A0A485KJM6_9STRA|nr:hypothetical protein As57867_008143 [Aphanomyces stellatus]VFT85061.1 Aste57867_8173 [Aphanomyces stellatus]